MHQKNTSLGLLGVVGIWITAGIALPFVNVLRGFTPEQLMVMRGFMTAAMVLIALKGVIGRADKYTYAIAFVLPFATLGMYKAVRIWGASATIIILTATPLVNLAAGLFLGRKITRTVVTGLSLILGGVVAARWGGRFEWFAFLWTMLALIAGGLLYELFAHAKSKPLQKCFWGMIGMGAVGLILSINDSWKGIKEPGIIFWLLGFAFVGGFLYWMANLVAFTHLPTNEASVLAQGETPAIILGAHFLLGEHLALYQWFGVVIALCGAGYLSHQVKKE